MNVGAGYSRETKEENEPRPLDIVGIRLNGPTRTTFGLKFSIMESLPSGRQLLQEQDGIG